MRLKIILAALALAAGSSQAAAQGVALRAQVVRPDPDENLQWSASVVQIDELRNQGGMTVKLFGTAAGDPAMNGLYTYLAFFESTQDGWRMFMLGDVLSYRIVSQARGRLTLEVRESVMDERTSDISTRIRRLLITWTTAADNAPPAFVSVTPLR